MWRQKSEGRGGSIAVPLSEPEEEVHPGGGEVKGQPGSSN